MLARIRKTQEENEGGFTLIELLVVIMIIGILSAIAIPTFLSQRTKAYSKSAAAEAASIGIAEESVVTDGGLYVAQTDAALAPAGYAHNPDVTLKVTLTGTPVTGYSACAVHTKGGDAYVITNLVSSPTKAASCP